MTKEPLVSILLPTFNRAHLLPQAVDSVLRQTYSNWELLIWNDGSTDNTKAILQTLYDPRIRMFNKSNHGYPYALNRLISCATGEYIAFLDDDDIWLHEKLVKQVNRFQSNPDIDLIFSNFENNNISKNLKNNGFLQCEAGLKKLKYEFIDGAKLIRSGFLKGIGTDNFIATDSAMLSRRVIKVLSGFNEQLATAQDFEFWWRAGLAGVCAAYTEDILLIRNKYPGSLSSAGLTTFTNTLRTLDACAEASHQAGREETIDFLRPAYRNVWQNLIDAYGCEGNISNAFKAFNSANHYGFSLGSFRLIMGAILNSIGKKLE